MTAPAKRGLRRVVILGAGFAGLAACDTLAAGGGMQVTVVDRHTYNTFQPLLYQVATAGLNPGDIAYPVRVFEREHPCVRFRQGVVVDVELDSRTVVFSEGVPPLSYDYLIVATGATTNFFGILGAAEHALPLYTMEDALHVRNALGASLEHAATFGTSRGELTVVLVGGGATGVEMAGTLAELREADLATTYRDLEPASSRIVLVEQKGRLLEAFSEKSSAYALSALKRRGVEVLLETAVSHIAADHVVVGDGEVISCGVVVWTAGVRAGELASRLGPAAAGGRVKVGADLGLFGRGDVFVVGDVAAVPDGEGGYIPQLAQPALQEGRHVARQILRLENGATTEPFAYRDKGTMATIGRRSAVAELPSGLRLRGTAAWLAWLLLHVFFLLGFRNRLAVLLNWAWRYVFWRRGTRVIAS